MRSSPLLLVSLAACTGQPIVLDSAQPDAAICEYETSYYCDYRSGDILASCTDYSSQAFDYLDAQSVENTGSGLAEACANNNATWGEGGCPVDDTWVGVCVGEVGERQLDAPPGGEWRRMALRSVLQPAI